VGNSGEVNDPAGKVSPIEEDWRTGKIPQIGETLARSEDRRSLLKDLAAKALNNTTSGTTIAPLAGSTMAVKPGWKAITAHLVWVMPAVAVSAAVEVVVEVAVVVEGDKR